MPIDLTGFLDRKQVIELLNISESGLAKDLAAGRFPPPADRGKWTHAQLVDYVSQVELHGGWNSERAMQAMQARRVEIFPNIEG